MSVIVCCKKYLMVLKQNWTRKMLKKCNCICGNMRLLCECMQIFGYAAYFAILKMPSYAEKYAICGFWQNIFAYNQHP